MTFTDNELKVLEAHPAALQAVIDWHDQQDSEAEATGWNEVSALHRERRLALQQIKAAAEVSHDATPKTPKVYSDEKPSDEFMNAVTQYGGIWAECACGRSYFYIGSGYDYDEGEEERWCQLAKEQPEFYIESGESVSHGEVDGKTLVWGCVCNLATRYEKWLYSHRFLAERYFSNLLRHRKVLFEQATALSEAELKLNLDSFGVIVNSVNDELHLEYAQERLEEQKRKRDEYRQKHPIKPEDRTGAIYLHHIRGYDRDDTYEEKAERLTKRGFIRMRSEPCAPDKKYWEVWWLEPWMAADELQGCSLEEIERWSLKQGCGVVEIVHEKWGLSVD